MAVKSNRAQRSTVAPPRCCTSGSMRTAALRRGGGEARARAGLRTDATVTPHRPVRSLRGGRPAARPGASLAAWAPSRCSPPWLRPPLTSAGEECPVWEPVILATCSVVPVAITRPTASPPFRTGRKDPQGILDSPRIAPAQFRRRRRRNRLPSAREHMEVSTTRGEPPARREFRGPSALRRRRVRSAGRHTCFHEAAGV
jgi:hypothetical protein